MKLFEYEDFEQAILRAARQFGLSEQFVEKDYYVTEMLRIIADRPLPGRAASRRRSGECSALRSLALDERWAA